MTDIVPLRRNVRFQLLWLGSAVSQTGSELTRLAMPLLVLALTGSPGLAGVVAGARTVALLLAQMPAGVWVDRWDRRRTLITAQGLQAAVSALLAALVLTGQVHAWHFVVLAVLDGLCAAFVGPAKWPMIPLMFITLSTPSLNVVMNVVIARMVPEEMLGRMGAVLSMGGTALKPLGPVLGGVLAAAVGGAASLVLLGGLLVLTAAAAALSKELRRFTREAPSAGNDVTRDRDDPRRTPA
ncbi:MFS transporter [Streptosporangium roseum]|uniref:MFS transporter n=1 Tax=Streptosporangium roseum TaxID=2001 RepID=UPI0033328081